MFGRTPRYGILHLFFLVPLRLWPRVPLLREHDPRYAQAHPAQDPVPGERRPPHRIHLRRDPYRALPNPGPLPDRGSVAADLGQAADINGQTVQQMIKCSPGPEIRLLT